MPHQKRIERPIELESEKDRRLNAEMIKHFSSGGVLTFSRLIAAVIIIVTCMRNTANNIFMRTGVHFKRAASRNRIEQIETQHSQQLLC